jgi:hypothetical protein
MSKTVGSTRAANDGYESSTPLTAKSKVDCGGAPRTVSPDASISEPFSSISGTNSGTDPL